ncbi:hypothetical protein, partial [Streptomyces sp. AK010]|uniref:hypothetical protein n=1 Tax=Streptomyces sp. AK010 TaxID=2723074 RepID=UPI001C870B76
TASRPSSERTTWPDTWGRSSVRNWGEKSVRRHAVMVAGRRSDFRTAATALRTGQGVPPERQVDVCRYVDLTQTFMAATVRWLARTGRFTPEPGPPAPLHMSGPPL